VQTERAHFDDLEAFSSDTQDVKVAATVNWHVDDANIQRLYREVGPGFFDKLVPTRVNQLFKDETVKYTAVRIAPERETIRKNVLAALKKELEPYSITVEDFLIDNIKFSPAFTNAIEDKVVATQEAQAAFNRIKKSRNNATALVAEAQGIKKSNQLKRQSLTPLLVQQAAIDKLNPNVEVIIVPSGSNFLLPSSIVKGSQ
jgi:regulator of protease activity HflC (stomatin/prohibitin superfamily)